MKDDKLYLIHGVDLERVWLIVERDLPDLKRMVAVMLQEQG
jgi:uncharacterized protein with HEPN domain